LDRVCPITPDGEGGWMARRGCWGCFAKDYQEPQIIELTLQDIANKFDIDISSIRIKE